MKEITRSGLFQVEEWIKKIIINSGGVLRENGMKKLDSMYQLLIRRMENQNEIKAANIIASWWKKIYDYKTQLWGESMIDNYCFEDNYDGIAEYRTAEGISKLVENKGPVDNTIRQMLGGLRSSCTYLNCQNITELSEKGQFIKI